MDPSAMDFMMHASEHVNQASIPSTDPTARSACPALREAAEHNQHRPPLSAYRLNPAHFGPIHNHPHVWQQGLPPPYARWSSDPFGYVHSPHMVPLPPNSGPLNQSPYPPSGPNTYQPPAPRYRAAPMLSLQRIGGTAPIQHTQGNLSGSNQNQNQPQGVIASGPGPGPTAHGPRANTTLPSINPIHPPSTSTSQTGQTGQPGQPQTFSQNSRPNQQSINHSPPPILRQSSVPSTSLSMAEVTVSSGGRNEAGPSSASSPSPPRRTPAASRTTETTGETTASEPRRTSATRNRRALRRLPSSESGWSSDDDSDPEATALGLLEAADAADAAIYGGPSPLVPGVSEEEDRMRAQQIVRGSVSGKRVASKKAITSLESVTISSLPENERTCVICYNDYGVQTPEGVSETPLRLPKCKHVFGDHCIKKWFQESDSCPYCRDKVPSEPHRHAMNAHNVYRFLRQHQQMLQMQQHRRDSELGRPEGVMQGFATPIVANNPFEMDVLTRRTNGAPMYDPRAAIWRDSGERHSPLPFNEVSDNRRRVRPRHGSLRGHPQTRPHFANSPPNNTSQTQQYPWIGRATPNHSHNRQHSMNSSTTNGRPTFDANIPPFQFQTSQIGVPSEHYLNPLNIPNQSGPGEASLPRMHSQHISPMSPTYAGPEVYMANADDPILYPGANSHQL